jgi:uncharacterized membrane protein
MLLLGLIMTKFPPKKINNWYGYRTASSMKNQQTWDEANRYSAKMMVIMGLILLIAGFLLTVLVNYLITDKQKAEGLMMGITIAMGILPAAIMIARTESHLDKTFNNKNEIR